MNEFCSSDHRYNAAFRNLPFDQGGIGRHKCPGCAYDRGFAAGLVRNESPLMEFDSLPESQAGEVRHRSPHAGWALGYLDGVRQSYGQ